MYPHERSLVKQLSDKPFAIVGVNSDGNLEKIRKIVDQKNLTWRSFQNDREEGAISDEWGVQGWPTVYLLDAEGVIRFKGHGVKDELIEKLLGEMGHEVKIVFDDPGAKERKKRKRKDDSDDAEAEAEGETQDGE